MQMNLGGMDGCRKGWLYVYLDKGLYAYMILEKLDELLECPVVPDRVLIDIPIGLSSLHFKRTVEQAMRKELGNRSSTVFNAPVRPAVYAANKEAARRHNRKLTGKSLSEQSLNITPKIKEADIFVTDERHAHIKLCESHPEICFKYLAGQIVQSKKSTVEGIEERLGIMTRYEPKIRDVYTKILTDTLRKDVKRDDIVDALCLCLVNRLTGSQPLKRIADTNARDAEGIPVGIAYYKK